MRETSQKIGINRQLNIGLAVITVPPPCKAQKRKGVHLKNGKSHDDIVDCSKGVRTHEIKIVPLWWFYF